MRKRDTNAKAPCQSHIRADATRQLLSPEPRFSREVYVYLDEAADADAAC